VFWQYCAARQRAYMSQCAVVRAHVIGLSLQHHTSLGCPGRVSNPRSLQPTFYCNPKFNYNEYPFVSPVTHYGGAEGTSYNEQMRG